jgi:hypothetical protein
MVAIAKLEAEFPEAVILGIGARGVPYYKSLNE